MLTSETSLAVTFGSAIMAAMIGVQDLKQSLVQHQMWLSLGLLEVKQRYRRSVLGPWWITISMLIFILAMGKIFSRLFAQNAADYIPYFTAGFLFWSFISTTINESTELLKSSGTFIKQIKLPYNIYFLKFFVRNFIILAHNFVVFFIVMLYYKLNPGWTVFLVIPGLLILFANLYWISLLVALVSARFRDMIPIITTSLQILFFITPISWTPKLLGENSIIVKLNPIVYLLDIVRQPLLGAVPSSFTYVTTLVLAGIGLWSAFKIFSRVKSLIPYWID
jgi:lipopolysaccharide transport system permease protein